MEKKVIKWYLETDESIDDADFHTRMYYQEMNKKRQLARDAIWKVFHLKFNYPESRKEWMLDQAEALTPVALNAFIANMKPAASWTKMQRGQV